MYSLKPAHLLTCLLSAWLLLGCDSSPKQLDHFEMLERPPVLNVTPTTENAKIDDEMAITNGLGKRVKLLGRKKALMIKIAADFDPSWQTLAKVLRQLKITVTDRDREQGYMLVNYDTDSYSEDQGFFGNLFSDHFGLRKYQINLKTTDNNTKITIKDLGAITKEANLKDGVEEVIDSKISGPEDSEYRLGSTLYKSLRDGFVEPEMRAKPG